MGVFPVGVFGEIRWDLRGEGNGVGPTVLQIRDVQRGILSAYDIFRLPYLSSFSAASPDCVWYSSQNIIRAGARVMNYDLK